MLNKTPISHKMRITAFFLFAMSMAQLDLDPYSATYDYEMPMPAKRMF